MYVTIKEITIKPVQGAPDSQKDFLINLEIDALTDDEIKLVNKYSMGHLSTKEFLYNLVNEEY